MARVATKPHERVLEYFRTADIGQAELVLDLAKAELKRRAELPASKPAATSPAKATTKTAAPKVAPVPKARKKPGPKPGSKRQPRQSHMDIPPAAPPLLEDKPQPLEDREEEFAHQ